MKISTYTVYSKKNLFLPLHVNKIIFKKLHRVQDTAESDSPVCMGWDTTEPDTPVCMGWDTAESDLPVFMGWDTAELDTAELIKLG